MTALNHKLMKIGLFIFVILASLTSCQSAEKMARLSDRQVCKYAVRYPESGVQWSGLLLSAYADEAKRRGFRPLDCDKSAFLCQDLGFTAGSLDLAKCRLNIITARQQEIRLEKIEKEVSTLKRASEDAAKRANNQRLWDQYIQREPYTSPTYTIPTIPPSRPVRSPQQIY